MTVFHTYAQTRMATLEELIIDTNLRIERNEMCGYAMPSNAEEGDTHRVIATDGSYVVWSYGDGGFVVSFTLKDNHFNERTRS